MQLSSFLIRLIFLGLPGILGYKLYGKLVGQAVRKDWEDVLEIILFALVSYALYGLILELMHRDHHLVAMAPPLSALFDEKLPLSWIEIGCASLIGMLLPFIASFINQRKLVNHLGRKFKVSNRFGDTDVWDFFHNMDKPEWVFVRDHKVNLIYYGWILAFSESEKDRELVMRDVQVFSNIQGPAPDQQKPLYESDVVYLSREPDQLSIEIPAHTGE